MIDLFLISISQVLVAAPCPAQIQVNSVADVSNAADSTTSGVCNTGNTTPSGVPECTLRAAFDVANACSGGSAGTIVVPAGTYRLTGGALQLAWSQGFFLSGHSALDTIIDGSSTASAQVGQPVINVSSVAPGVSIGDVTITGGQDAGVRFTGFTVVSMSDVAIVGNENDIDDGGGVWTDAFSSLLINNSLIANNHTSGKGGGVFTQTTSVFQSCTIADNSSGDDGGGIFAWKSATLSRTTVTGNQSGGAGCTGGVDASGGIGLGYVADPTHSLIALNSATGGGCTESYDIRCGTGGTPIGTSYGALVGALSPSCAMADAATNGNLVAVPAADIVGSLSNAGGETLTLKLNPGAGGPPPLDNTDAMEVTADQRHTKCLAAASTTTDNAYCDSGAFEYDPVDVAIAAGAGSASGTSISAAFTISHSAISGLIDHPIGTSQVAFVLPGGLTLDAGSTVSPSIKDTGRDCESPLDAPTQLLCLVGPLDVGAEGSINLNLKTNGAQCGQTVNLTAQLTSTQDSADAPTDNDSASFQVTFPGPSLILAATPAASAPGANVTLTATVSNNTGADVSGGTLTAQLPVGLTVVSASVNGAPCDTSTAGQVTCANISVPDKESAAASFVVSAAEEGTFVPSVGFLDPNCAPVATQTITVSAASGSSGGSSGGGSTGSAGSSGGSTGSAPATPTPTAKSPKGCRCHSAQEVDVFLVAVTFACISKRRRKSVQSRS